MITFLCLLRRKPFPMSQLDSPRLWILIGKLLHLGGGTMETCSGGAEPSGTEQIQLGSRRSAIAASERTVPWLGQSLRHMKGVEGPKSRLLIALAIPKFTQACTGRSVAIGMGTSRASSSSFIFGQQGRLPGICGSRPTPLETRPT